MTTIGASGGDEGRAASRHQRGVRGGGGGAAGARGDDPPARRAARELAARSHELLVSFNELITERWCCLT